MRYLPFLFLLLTGCAHYEYDLIQPMDQRLHAGTKEFATARIDPLRYELITAENRLVMEIRNPTDQPVALAGDKSYILDGSSRSRSVQGITIAPGSYVKFIFPPPKPYVQDDGGFRVGMGVETAGGFHDRNVGTGVGYDTGGPRRIGNLDENYYWEWDDEDAVKFHFAYTSDGKSFAHDLVIKRTKT